MILELALILAFGLTIALLFVENCCKRLFMNGEYIFNVFFIKVQNEMLKETSNYF